MIQTLKQFLLIRRAHTQTHTQNEKKPRVFIGPSQPWRETSWGPEFGGVPDRRRKWVFRDAAPDKCRWFGPQSHVWDSWFVAELRW